MWQALHEELADHGFVVIAVAMDSREGDPLPWIEAAKPTYPVLIDREHRLAELYGIVNVPQAVWIDEAGRIVRPAEPAGAYEGFRQMNRADARDAGGRGAAAPRRRRRRTSTRSATGCAAARGARTRSPPSRRARTCAAPDRGRGARAAPSFRLGQHLIRRGERGRGRALARRRPAGSIRTPGASGASGAGVNEQGLAALPDFWERVDALGEQRYYARVDMPGMP